MGPLLNPNSDANSRLNKPGICAGNNNNNNTKSLTQHGANHVELGGAGADVAPARFDRDSLIGVFLALSRRILLRIVTARPIDASVAHGGDYRSDHVLFVLHGFPVEDE